MIKLSSIKRTNTEKTCFLFKKLLKCCYCILNHKKKPMTRYHRKRTKKKMIINRRESKCRMQEKINKKSFYKTKH